MATRKKIATGCRRCSGRGYMISSENGEYARAEICGCVSECSSCGGSGTVFLENERGYRYLERCGLCGMVRLKIRRYNNAKIPSKYAGVLQSDDIDPRDPSQYDAMTYVKSFIDKYPEEKGFLLMGGPGLAKTRLAVGAIAELTLQKAVECVFTDFFFLLADLRKAYSEGTPENEIIGPLVNAEILVIDEMGKGKSSEWEQNILDQLISKRYNSSKKTLVTTNYVARESLPEKSKNRTEILEDRVGERIASRLYEMCTPLFIEGSDYRKNEISA